MKFIERVDKWLAAFEKMDLTPRPPEETMFENYPAAWERLQQRRVLVIGSDIVMFSGLLLMVLPRVLFNFFPLVLPLDRSWEVVPGTVVIVMGRIMINVASTFKCPRCGQSFFTPGSRNIENEMKNPTSRCRACLRNWRKA